MPQSNDKNQHNAQPNPEGDEVASEEIDVVAESISFVKGSRAVDAGPPKGQG